MLATLRQRNFVLLWLGGLISQIGDWLLRISLPVYIYTLTGSALQTSFMLIISYVPGIMLGSLSGVMVDRWDRRKTLLTCNLLTGLALLSLLLVHSQADLWIIYSVQFICAGIAQFMQPAENALIPQLVGEADLVSANSLNSISQNASRLLGGALGGLCIAWVSLAGVALLDGASFFFVCTMLLFIRIPLSAPSEAASEAASEASSTPILALKRFGQDWLDGLRIIIHQRVLTMLFIMLALQSIGEGVFGVLLIIFVEKVLGYDSVVFGSLMSFQAVGSILGGLLFSWIGKRFIPIRMLGVCALLFGLIDLIIIDIHLFAPGIFILFFLFVLVGIPGTGIMVSTYSLFQSEVEDKLRGRVFGTFMTIEAIMVLIGMGLAGFFGDQLGATLLLNMQGSVYALSGLFVLMMLGTLASHKQPVVEEKGDLVA